jgi:hypothetical protein
VEVEWQAASTAGANDGYMNLYIGDQLVSSLTGLDTDTQAVNEMSLGVMDKDGGSGTIYFDGYASSTGAHVGLAVNGPSVPTALTPPDALFADDFESGDLSAWAPTLSTVDGGDLFASDTAAHESSYGLQALIDDTVSIKVIDPSPADETHYRARFYFNPNSLTMSSGSSHVIFEGYDTLYDSSFFQLELFQESGVYKLRPRVKNDGGSYTTGTKQTISDDWHVVELEWQQSSSTDADDGFLSFWLDGALMQTIGGMDIDRNRVDQVKLGAVSSVDSTTSGSMLFDHFVSRRSSYIGLIPAPTATPTQTETVTVTPTFTETPTLTSTP